MSRDITRCPRQDSNLRFRLRRPALYPLSYGGGEASLATALPGPRRRPRYPRAMHAPAPHVLVVDDDPVIVRLLELNFRLGGFRVSSAGRGDQAVEVAVATE